MIDLVDLSLTFISIGSNPFDLAAVLPLTLLLYTVLTNVSTDSVLFTSFPFANVFAAISPNECAITFTFIIDKLTSVHLSIFPLELAFTVHFVLAPVTRV